MRKKLIRWREPVIIPRYILMVKYLCFVGVGVAVYVASSPSLDLTTGAGYTGLWGITVGLSSIGCLVGSMDVRLETVERWAVLVLAALLIGYACAPLQLVLSGDTNRLAYSTLAVTLAILPTARAVQLIRRVGAHA